MEILEKNLEYIGGMLLESYKSDKNIVSKNYFQKRYQFACKILNLNDYYYGDNKKFNPTDLDIKHLMSPVLEYTLLYKEKLLKKYKKYYIAIDNRNDGLELKEDEEELHITLNRSSYAKEILDVFLRENYTQQIFSVDWIANVLGYECVYYSNSLKDIDKMNNLRVLNLSFTDAQKIVSFDNYDLPYLETLKLQYSQLSSFKNNNLPSLIDLDLSYNTQLTSFVNNKLLSLIDLNLSYNKLTSFESNNLLSLKTLNLKHSFNMESFRNINLPLLETLNLQGGKLSSFENNDLPSLKTLDLSVNKITSFNNYDLPLLTNLTLRVNQLTSFENNELPSLTNLDLTYNKLTSLDYSQFSTNIIIIIKGNRNFISPDFIPPNIVLELDDVC